MKRKFDHCYCYGIPFSELIEVAKKNNIKNVDDLKKVVEFGEACGTCNIILENLLRQADKSDDEGLFS